MKVIFALAAFSYAATATAYQQADTGTFVSDFPKYVARAYTALDNEAPAAVKAQCASLPRLASAVEVVVSSSDSSVSAAAVQAQCGTSNICVIEGKVLEMSSPFELELLNVLLTQAEDALPRLESPCKLVCAKMWRTRWRNKQYKLR